VNTYRIATLIVRLSGIGWLFNAADEVTYLPMYVLREQAAHPNTFAAHAANVEISMMWVRILTHTLFGACLFVGWKRVALFLTRGTGRIKPMEWQEE
jgi:hypothetical protein